MYEKWCSGVGVVEGVYYKTLRAARVEVEAQRLKGALQLLINRQR